MKKTTALYKFIEAYAESISDKDLLRMMNSTQGIIDHMLKTKTYKAIERDIRSGVLDSLSFKETEDVSELDANLMIWLSGLQTAAASLDDDHMLIQANVFIAAQRANIYRIENDKIRVIVTYSHFRILRELLS